MKTAILSDLSGIVNNIDSHNYESEFIKIKNLLGKLKGNIDPTTLEEVCEIFGDDYTVREILTKYFNGGNDSIIAGLKEYLSASTTALDSESVDYDDNSSILNDIPNINTDYKETMNKEDLIKDDVDSSANVIKLIVELPVNDAAKVLSVIDNDSNLGSDIADELAKFIVKGDTTAEVSDTLKPVSGKIVQIIDTRSDILPENFSVSQVKSFNKYMLLFSEATDVETISDELLSKEAGEMLEESCNQCLEVPSEFPDKATVVETNSAVPTVEDVQNTVHPTGYVDTEMVSPGEEDSVDALNEVTDALVEMDVEPASEALALIAENVGPSAADAIQGEVLSKVAPESFSDFARNSWMTDMEVFSAYNILDSFLRGNITNFSTESGEGLKYYYMDNFSKASEIISFSKTSSVSAVVDDILSFLKKARNKTINAEVDDIATISILRKSIDDLADEISKIKDKIQKTATKLKDAKLTQNTANQAKYAEDLQNLNFELSSFQNELNSAISASNSITSKYNNINNVTEKVVEQTVGDFLKKNWGKTAIAGGTAVGAGGLGGMALTKSTEPVYIPDDSEGFNFSATENAEALNEVADHIAEEELKAEEELAEEAEEGNDNVSLISESDEILEAAESVMDVNDIAKSTELLSEVAERVSPEVALAIQAEICKEDSDKAKEIVDTAIIDKSEVLEAINVINDVKENGTSETFSEVKSISYDLILSNFADVAEEMIERGELDEDDEEDEDLEDIDPEDVSLESPEMDEIIETISDLPTVSDAAEILVKIEEEVGPEAALAVQSELLKENNDLFKEINNEIVIDDSVVKEIYSVVKGFAPGVESFSKFGRNNIKRKYLQNFAVAISNDEKAKIVDEVKEQVMKEIAEGGVQVPEGENGAPMPPAGPEGAPMPPVGPNGVPMPPVGPDGAPMPPVGPDGVPMPPVGPEGAPMPPVGPDGAPMPPVGPNGIPLPPVGPDGAPVPPVPHMPPVGDNGVPPPPPPGMMAAPQAPVNVEQPGVQIPQASQVPVDTMGVEVPDIKPVVPPLLNAPTVPPPHPFMGNEGVSDVPALPMEPPSEAVATSTTGDFVPGTVNAPKYVHLIPQNPIEQATVETPQIPPVLPAVGNPQLPPADQLSDVEIQKAITDNFSRVRKPTNFSSTKESDIEAYKRTMMGF